MKPTAAVASLFIIAMMIAVIPSRVAATNVCPYQPISLLVSEYPPFFNTTDSKLLGSSLDLVINMPLVENRTDVQISFYNSLPECNFPGTYWSHTLDTNDCLNVYTSAIPWINVGRVDCGFVRSQTVGSITYQNYVNVSYEEYFEIGARTENITRHVNNILDVSLVFPRNISLTANFTVFTTSVSLEAVLQEVSFDAVDSVGTIIYVTSVQWPYKLANSSMLPDTGYSLEITEITAAGQCPAGVDGNTGNPTCTQVWQITVLPGSNCVLTNTYEATYNVICHNTVNCPLTAAEVTANVTALVTSTSFCPTLTVNTILQGVLTPYADSAHTAQKSLFVHDQIIYFQGVVTSDQATVGNVTVVQVEIVKQSGNQSPVYLCGPLDCSSLSLQGSSANFIYSTPTNTVSDFQFIVTVGAAGNNIFQLNPDDRQLFFITATFVVDYEDTFNGRKRSSVIKRQGTLGSGGYAVGSIGTQTQVQIESTTTNQPSANPNSGGSTSSSGSSNGSLAGAVAGSIVAGVVVGSALVAGYLNHKKKDSKVGVITNPNDNELARIA